MTSRFVTFNRVLTPVLNASLPSTATVYATADVSSTVTVCPETMRTTWLADGICPPCHVEGLDQLPLCTLWTLGRDASAENSGMPSGSAVAAAGALTAAVVVVDACIAWPCTPE